MKQLQKSLKAAPVAPRCFAGMPASLAMSLRSRSRRSSSAILLPVEILVLIFKIGCFGYSDKISARRFIRNISHVSQHWRQVSINHQVLWTDVVAKLDTKNITLRPIEEPLTRSGTLPIDITFISTIYMDIPTLKESTKSMFKMISPHAHRWRSFQAQCRGHVNLKFVIDGLRHIKAPIIEHLQLDLEGDPDSWWIQPSEILDGGAPLLRSVALHNGICLAPMHAVQTLYLANVFHTHAHLNSTVNAIFEDTPLRLLRDLTISGYIIDSTYLLAFMSNIVFPSLITLRLLAYQGQRRRGPQIEFLRAISAPVLQCLVLEDISSQEIRHLSLDRPEFPMLRSLAVASAEDIIVILLRRIFPEITHLNLRNLPMQASRFLHPSSPVQLCSHLEVLTMHELPSSQVTPLCDSLAERSLSCPLPRRIVLRNCNTSAVDAFLTSLRDRELHIEVYASARGDVPWYEDVKTWTCW